MTAVDPAMLDAMSVGRRVELSGKGFEVGLGAWVLV